MTTGIGISNPDLVRFARIVFSASITYTYTHVCTCTCIYTRNYPRFPDPVALDIRRVLSTYPRMSIESPMDNMVPVCIVLLACCVLKYWTASISFHSSIGRVTMCVETLANISKNAPNFNKGSFCGRIMLKITTSWVHVSHTWHLWECSLLQWLNELVVMNCPVMIKVALSVIDGGFFSIVCCWIVTWC